MLVMSSSKTSSRYLTIAWRDIIDAVGHPAKIAAPDSTEQGMHANKTSSSNSFVLQEAKLSNCNLTEALVAQDVRYMSYFTA